MKRILVAGIGNKKYGDDAFGLETVARLRGRKLPKNVDLTDLGTRCDELAQALTAGYDAVILLDATPRNQVPGTLYLVEEPDDSDLVVVPHRSTGVQSTDPAKGIKAGRDSRASTSKLYLISCEPEDLRDTGGELKLSNVVARLIPEAIGMVEEVIHDVLGPTDPALSNHSEEEYMAIGD